MESRLTGSRSKVFYGWWVVATAAVGLSLGPAPIIVFSFSVFLKPLARELHSNRAAVSLAFTLFNLMIGLSSPLAGKLTDRFRARRVILPCTVFCALTLISSNVLAAKLWEIYTFYVVLGLFGSATSIVPYSNVVSHWFDRRRGLALGLMASGGGLGAMIMPSLSQRLIASFGWRFAYTIVAAPILLIATPLIATFLKERPDEVRILRDGPTRRPIALERDDLGMSWREAWHSGTFWLVLSGYCFVGTGIHGCMIHLSAMLTDRGSSAQIAALASSLIGVGSMTGRLLSGYLLDRFFAPKVAASIFAGVAVAMAAFCISGGMGIAFPAAFLVGLGLGAEGDIVAYLISRYFGLRSFGEIYGYAFSGFVLTGALGPLLMGAGFDRTGSYVLPLVVFSAAASIAATLMTRLGPYQYVVLETSEGGMISA